MAGQHASVYGLAQPIDTNDSLAADEHTHILNWLAHTAVSPNIVPQDLLEGTLSDLLRTYDDLNADAIDELSEEPSPLEFMRFVARNRPFVVRKGAGNWPALKKWNTNYLASVMGDQLVQVAITPHGNADAPVEMDDDELLFVKPYETEEPFRNVMSKIQQQEQYPAVKGNTRYAQTQNDNLRNEYQALFSDVPKDIPFARIALEKSPDAINFWLGNSYSTTALHKDNYENVYVQVLGKKHFVLLPPAFHPCVNEQLLPAATYAILPRATPVIPGEAANSQNEHEDLVVCVDDPPAKVPFATWDPDAPTERATPFSRLARPVRVTLEEGDMLYLPALWYHKVSQSCSEEGISCSVNYWYDLDFSGPLWPHSAFIRSMSLLALGQNVKRMNGD